MRSISQHLALIETDPQIPETPAVPSPARRYTGIITAAVIVATLIVLSLLYTRIAQTVTVNSDNASIVLEADAVLHGNPLLRGWTLATESFYTLDLPFYLVDVAWHGIRPRVMREVPAVVYALTVLGAVWLAGRGPGRRSPWLGRAMTFFLIGLPSMLMPGVLLVGVDHDATMLAIVGSLIVLDIGEERLLSKTRWLLWGILCTLLVIGDPMGLVLFIVPTILVSMARALRRASGNSVMHEKPLEVTLVVVTITSVALAHIFLKVVHHIGGFGVTPLTLKIVPLATLPTNLLLLIQGMLSLFRADVFGETVDTVMLGSGINLLGLGLVLWNMFCVLRAWIGRRQGGDRIAQILSVGMAINLITLLFDNAVFDPHSIMSSPAERYLIPFFLFGTILAGRFGIEQISSLNWQKMAIAALGVIAITNLTGQLQMPDAEVQADSLVQWLQARGLKYGYGNYWCSSIVTAESMGAVRVRPVEAEGNKIAGKHWFSDAHWYHATPAHFLVYDISENGKRYSYFGNIDLQSATQTFGVPTETDKIDGYTVLIWKKDITPDLRP